MGTMAPIKITFLGAGNMAKSIVTGLLTAGFDASHIMMTGRNKTKLSEVEALLQVSVTTDNVKATQWADVVVVAVKPMHIGELIDSLDRPSCHSGKLFVSILAGIPLGLLKQKLPQVDWVRCMPNTPVAIGKGVSGLYAEIELSQSNHQRVTDLFAMVGRVLWLKSESMIDNITAAAGSAPAYFYLFIEAMMDECIAMGFEPDEARLLVTQVGEGAIGMVQAYPNKLVTLLRQEVTSKKGTTEAALEVMIAEGLPEVIARAMQAAVARAQALGATLAKTVSD